jgi:hypothetical protein
MYSADHQGPEMVHVVTFQDTFQEEGKGFF